jgi:muconolactone delta-isomerase
MKILMMILLVNMQIKIRPGLVIDSAEQVLAEQKTKSDELLEADNIKL